MSKTAGYISFEQIADLSEATLSFSNIIQISEQLNSTLMLILSEDEISGKHLKLIEHLKQMDEIINHDDKNHRDNKFIEFFFNKLTQDERLAVIKALMLKQFLVNIAIKIGFVSFYKTVRGQQLYIQRISSASLHKSLPKINFNLGMYGKETEPGSEEMIKALREVSIAVENELSKNDLKNAMRSLWSAAWLSETYNDTSIQLFYANIIYDNLSYATAEIKKILVEAGYKDVDIGSWFNAYTWLTTDRDGRPYDTNEVTEKLIIEMEMAIKARYAQDLKSLIATQPNNNQLINMYERLQPNANQPYVNVQQFIKDLEECNMHQHVEIENLISKAKAFGFYYLSLEFRENSHMFDEIIDEIVPSLVIEEILQKNINYLKLSSKEKTLLLTHIQEDHSQYRPAKLWQDYLAKKSSYIKNKMEEHKKGDYIDLLTSDPEYIRVINVKNAIERFELIKKYADRIHIHGIAETKGTEDPLAVLFIMEAAGLKNGIDIALQPEDSKGAANIIKLIRAIYENPVYKKHLSLRNNKQYITFGPSDTGKQGGKAMHKANMQISNLHKEIASHYNIETILHVIVGFEHARCNACYRSNLKEYGALESSHTRYMMAGLNEMRSHLLTPEQTLHCLKELYLVHLEPQYNKLSIAERERQLNNWFKVTDKYQEKFFENPALPKFLKKLARFDVINATNKGTRPPSRVLNIKQLEDKPDAIRAIPWGRSLLLAGIHFEVLGASVFANEDANELYKQYKNDISFRAYIKHVAYGVARTDMLLAWNTLLGYMPDMQIIEQWEKQFTNEENQPEEYLLAWVHVEINQAKRLVYKAMYGEESVDLYNISINKLLAPWPVLIKEVQWKEKNALPYKIILQYTRKNPELVKKGEFIKDFFTGCLTVFNTDISMFHPEAAQEIASE